MDLLANNLRGTFADRLRQLREARGWDQHDLSAAMNKEKPDALRGWEQQKRWPQPEEIEAVAQALGVTAGELLAERVVVREPTTEEILDLIREALSIAESPNRLRLIRALSALDEREAARHLAAIEKETATRLGAAPHSEKKTKKDGD